MALQFILFFIFPSVIRVWILSSKNSLEIFSKLTVFTIYLWMLSVYVSPIIILTYLEYNWKNSIINFIVGHLLLKDTCSNNDNSINSCQMGWRREINGHWTCQTVTITFDFIQNHMLLEKNVRSPKNQNANIFKNSQL